MFSFNKTVSVVFAAAAILLVFSLVAGCHSGKYDKAPDSMLDTNWGRAFEAAKYNQMANPDAPENLDSPTGIDGQAADSSMEMYRSGFKGEKAPEVYNLNIGGSGCSK